jgi:hypothetical protein
MAHATHNGMPIGPWRTDIKTAYWLMYKTFMTSDDDSGNDVIRLNQHMRVMLQQAVGELQQHKVNVVNAQCEEMFDPKSYVKVRKLALGFECREDLVMAKLLLKCDE